MVVQLESVVLSKVRGLGRELPRIRKMALRDVGEFWHKEILDDHFRPGASAEYDHETRDPEWLANKRLIGRGQGKAIDNVLFGKSRRFLSHAPRITATSRGVTVRMDAPLYFVRPKHKTPGHPDKPEEITRVSIQDRAQISRRMESRIRRPVERILRNIQARKVG